MNIVFAIFEDKKNILKDMFKAYIYMIIYMLGCYLFNYIFGTQYNLLNQFLNKTLLDIFPFLIANKIFNNVVLLIVGILFNLSGLYILNIINNMNR